MTKVYAVAMAYEWPEGVFTSKEKAQEYIDRTAKRCDLQIYIETFELDKPEEEQ